MKNILAIILILFISIGIFDPFLVAIKAADTNNGLQMKFDKVEGYAVYHDFSAGKDFNVLVCIDKSEVISELYGLLTSSFIKDISKTEEGRNFLNGRVFLSTTNYVHLVFYYNDEPIHVYDLRGFEIIILDSKKVFSTGETNLQLKIGLVLKKYGYIGEEKKMTRRSRKD